MFKIKFLQPYSWEWKIQSFDSLDKAERMIVFYKSCGTPAQLV